MTSLSIKTSSCIAVWLDCGGHCLNLELQAALQTTLMPNQYKQSVLIVDDEPLNIRVLSQALTPWYRVKAATSGAESLTVATSDDRPDLILLDISMPGMDGYEVCAKLKSNPLTEAIPVIFITAKNATEDEAKGLELGAVDYITKPFSLPIVMARIRNQLLLKTKTDMLEQLVSIDSLTGVCNRRSFDEILFQEWRRCGRTGSQLTIIMIDIDHFKNLNDQFGHVAGDQCLKQVASSLKNTMRRSSDSIARYGGEEFACVVPDVSHEEATELANNLRQKIESLKIQNPIRDNPQNTVTISLGVATTSPNRSFTAADILKKADEALYQAKEKGRNRVIATLFQNPEAIN